MTAYGIDYDVFTDTIIGYKPNPEANPVFFGFIHMNNMKYVTTIGINRYTGKLSCQYLPTYPGDNIALSKGSGALVYTSFSFFV